jgi:hypothetical protein
MVVCLCGCKRERRRAIVVASSDQFEWASEIVVVMACCMMRVATRVMVHEKQAAARDSCWRLILVRRWVEGE